MRLTCNQRSCNPDTPKTLHKERFFKACRKEEESDTADTYRGLPLTDTRLNSQLTRSQLTSRIAKPHNGTTNRIYQNNFPKSTETLDGISHSPNHGDKSTYRSSRTRLEKTFNHPLMNPTKYANTDQNRHSK